MEYYGVYGTDVVKYYCLTCYNMQDINYDLNEDTHSKSPIIKSGGD